MKNVKWSLDSSHSEIQFKVKHLMISTVTGNFRSFEAAVESDSDDFNDAAISFSADINSITTNNEQRDGHLQNGDFFDAENHPKIYFKSDSLEKIDDENYRMKGVLTMRGVSRKETFNVEFGGVAKDPWGNTRAGFAISGKINRKDYGVSFGAVSETGAVLLGEEVKIFANTEFVKQAEAVAA